MAAAALSHATSGATRRRSCWVGTPEIYFAKQIDNSRLVKIEDAKRSREMRQFSIALGCLFVLVMVFAWQHFKAIEYGYKIQSLKIQHDGLVEINRALRMEEASLRDPFLIDKWARVHGLQPPAPGQIVPMDTPLPDNTGPVMASVAPVAVISVR
jgi:cell division protein FtsL